MLPRLLLVIVVSVVWAKEKTTITETATKTETDMEEEADTETETGAMDYNYFPKWLIESTKEPYEADTLIISSRKPRVTGKVKGGTVCLNTDECGRGKCCLRRSKSPRRRCRRLQRAGERCTEEQMMGGYYYGFCPCNKRSVCMYINGTQKCVKEKKKPSQKPLPLPLPPSSPQTNVTQKQAQESQESEEVQTTPKLPSMRPAFNLSGNQPDDIPEFFRKKMRLTPAPATFPGTPLPVPAQGVGPAPPLPTAPVIDGGAGISGGTPIPQLPPGLTLTPITEDEGLPGSEYVPKLPPPPVFGSQVPAGGIETGLPGEGDLPPLPPPPALGNGENDGATLRRSSRSASPSPDARLREQSPLVPPIVASAVTSAPPFDFKAVDGNEQQIL